MSFPKKNRNFKNESGSKLDEFPEDFDDVFFHNLVVDQDRKIPVLRSIVYKKIKNAIIDRSAEYKTGGVELEDKFTVDFTSDGFTKFQWAVVREELLGVGFDASFEFDETGNIKSLHVPIERSISVTETLKEKDKREQEEDFGGSDSD